MRFDPTIYTLVVGNPGNVDPLIIVLKTLSVADMGGLELKGDQFGTYRKPPPPAGDTTKPVVTITGPSYIDSVSGGMVRISSTEGTVSSVSVTNATQRHA